MVGSQKRFFEIKFFKTVWDGQDAMALLFSDITD